MSATPPSRVDWLSDLIRLEITLWNRVDAQLRAEHSLPLAYFWPLHVVSQSPEGSMRVGEIARELSKTVGGTSKVLDRIVETGLLRREPDAGDRRASRVALTDEGRRTLQAASQTYEADMATVLDATLSEDEQRCMQRLVTRLLDAADADGSA